ncbi:ROK family protein [Paenibacillus melissococcoides]|uniref:ROK family protein n=1 Tax=Paenibacillus melissococcoides TaxID=2912268 RepID=A0ABM9G0E8_9BACL|nr:MULTISPECIES: ROK family protein [Paenibacillus]MEB9896845.1 ROK family protein [Bacillus cereus]CAH8245046.1 ROK family protein [Paenibacillus melissococcoides]CAH8709742.1 ROK family protein [Paenibacillus melissococcoides]CAH8710469.1 ROK family protein [Paenibacillus melissococcoides]GIO81566.1 transcriptional regulator [Paenibacillus dendritiformis]
MGNALEQRIPSKKGKELFQRIRRAPEISKNDLVSESGLTVSTLTRVLEELTALGLIVESGFGASTGGRRPILYRVRAEYGYAFGLDISRTSSRLVLLDTAGQLKAAHVIEMNDQMTPERLVERVTAHIHTWMDEYRLNSDTALGLGIGAVGPLNRFDGVILQPEYFPAPGWENVPIVAELERRLHLPVLLDNGANTAIRAEAWANRSMDVRHMLYFHVGIGLRSAMMSDGKLIYGAVDMEGALGQMIIQADGIPNRSANGNYGCLDSYATIYALEREANAMLRIGRRSLLEHIVPRGEPAAFPHIIEAMKKHDPLVTELVTQAATYFGVGLANLLNVLHPERVVLGGPFMNINDLYFYTATQTAIRKTYHYPQYQVVFSKGSYGEDALAVGGALMVLDQLTAPVSPSPAMHM